MAITFHPDIEIASGEPITIKGLLVDANGQPVDVTNCTLAFALLDHDGAPVAPLNVTISKTDPTNGVISIEIPAAYTALPPGRYTDGLQVTEGMSTEVFWVGQILIAANLFNVADMTA
jgi:hypothetical protein